MGKIESKVSNHTDENVWILIYNGYDPLYWIQRSTILVLRGGFPVRVEGLPGGVSAIQMAVIYNRYAYRKKADLFLVPEGSELEIRAMTREEGVTEFSGEGVMMLKKCIPVSEFPISNGRELVNYLLTRCRNRFGGP
ncbi:uncharacterized protein LOC143277509 [Babylonia areolata]|uniref:uncharacterized protein LOC143277509 n=1 Tax=Babylonia areolata TaxID=304850 RepID=UPI003FCFDC91